MWKHVCFLVVSSYWVHVGYAQTYEEAVAGHAAALGQDVPKYHTDVRPLRNQSNAIYVYFSMSLVSIVKVDDIEQSFTINAFVNLFWFDEIARWDPDDHGGLPRIRPKPADFWRPRVILSNTFGDRDLFKDDFSPTDMRNDGFCLWIPGGLIPTSCKLNLRHFPFDKQECEIVFFPNLLQRHELVFVVSGEDIDLGIYTENGEWEIISAKSEAFVLDGDGLNMSSMRFTFKLQRRPSFFILNIVLPVVLLSFLNILVFLIPVDSGEKISYGITVLLALAVFMSIISGLLPNASDVLPIVVIYLFILLILSVLSVILSIIIVYLHHLEEKVESFQKSQRQYQSALTKIKNLRTAVNPFKSPKKEESAGNEEMDIPSIESLDAKKEKTKLENNNWVSDMQKPKRNKYKIIGKYIDMVCFVVFIVVWLGCTLGFLIYMATV